MRLLHDGRQKIRQRYPPERRLIIPDINLLIYAYCPDSPSHDRARQWWSRCLSEGEPVGLPYLSLFGFLRLTTHRSVFAQPFSLRDAGRHIRSWLEQPNLSLVEPAPDHFDRVVSLLDDVGAAGKIVTDAQFAALAIEQRAVLHTADSDFARFPTLKWFNPLTGARWRR